MTCFICGEELINLEEGLTCINPDCSLLGEDIKEIFVEDIIEGAEDKGIKLTYREAEKYLEEYGECFIPCEH